MYKHQHEKCGPRASLKYLVSLLVLLIYSGSFASDSLTGISISNDNIGNLKMMLPEKWRGSQSTDEMSGATVYDIASKKERFRLRLEFKYIGQEDRDDKLSLDEYIQLRLQNYMEYRMPEFLENSVEGHYATQAFGPGSRGQYSRLTIRDKARGDYPFLTHGARVVGNTIIMFTLLSSDADEGVLSRTLDAVSSVEADNEIASFVGSYACRTEHRVGFAGRNAVWIPEITDVVDQQFIVRTSSEGDQFAEKSSWVFVELGRIRATSWCDENLVGQGLFVCHGAGDEEFRMDTSTLRFLYVQIEGYYDVAEGDTLDKNQATPFMDIGTCKRNEN
jgi:hypothetical protein